jgi:hypothetical protein
MAGAPMHWLQAGPPVNRWGVQDGRLSTAALGPQASADLRDRLPAELSEPGSEEAAARCGPGGGLPRKPPWRLADACKIEEAFRAKLAGFVGPPGAHACPTEDVLSVKPTQGASGGSEPQHGRADELAARPLRRRARPKRVVKGMLALVEPRRQRNREHLRFVAKQPCPVRPPAV